MAGIRTAVPMPHKLLVSKNIGFDLYANPMYGKPAHSRCAILKLEKTSKDTTVRADSSATRGHAQEVLSDAWLLVPHNMQVGLGDKLELKGFTLKVTGFRARFGAFGDHDHNEVMADINNG
ncbi:hypothetical protein [Castellaniella sp.]|uniref:hypothetical protein n=1 Tax=Castellaniella sp. TaxID=1955812 RepID=UPI002AFE34B4|nr:hypothetical protein [Castellaniella sp.]